MPHAAYACRITLMPPLRRATLPRQMLLLPPPRHYFDAS